MASSNFPNRPFRLEERVSVKQQSAWNAGNNTLLHSELWIIKNSYSPTSSGASSNAAMQINGAQVGNNGSFGYNFVNSDSLLVLSQDNWFQNDGSGYLHYQVTAQANVDILGSTSLVADYDAPRISRPPGATYIQTINQITTNSIHVVGVYPDNGGANIDLFCVQAASNPAMTTDLVQNFNGLDVTMTGLIPGKPYYINILAHNANGWTAGPVYGPYTTQAAVYVSNGSSWLPAQVLRSDGTQWRSLEVLYSKAGVWTTPTSL